MERWQRYYMIVWQPPIEGFGGGAGEDESDEDGEGEGEGQSEGEGEGEGEGEAAEGEAEFSTEVREQLQPPTEDQDDSLAWNTSPDAKPPKLESRMAEKANDPRWEKLADEVSTALSSSGAAVRNEPNPDAPEIHEAAKEMTSNPLWETTVGMTRGQPSLVKSVGPMIVDALLGGDSNEMQETLEAVATTLAKLRADLALIAPGLEDVHPEDLPNDNRLAIAEKLLKDPRIRAILELAGRIASQAFAKRMEFSPEGRDEVKSVEHGNDITRVLTSQLAGLGDPDLEVLFLKDFVESTLLLIEMHGKEPARRGPIILALDESGSMAPDPDAAKKAKAAGVTALSRNDVASAIAIGALRMAHVQKRDVYLCGFNEEIRWTRTVKKKSSPVLIAELVNFLLGRGADGGTGFNAPLQWAISLVERAKIGADIIFLTDGHGQLDTTTTQRLRQAKAKQGLGMFLLLIEAAAEEPLASLADSTVDVRGENGCLDFGKKFIKRTKLAEEA